MYSHMVVAPMTPEKPQQAILTAASATAANGTTPPPVFANDPMGKKPKQKSGTPTFLGTGSVPDQSNMGSKTLIGQ